MSLHRRRALRRTGCVLAALIGAADILIGILGWPGRDNDSSS